MTATRAEQALILADVASRRRLSPEEAALLRRRIRELAAIARRIEALNGPQGADPGPLAPEPHAAPERPSADGPAPEETPR